jgi:hypothetical protein
LRRGSKTKKWQIEAKPTWRENQWVQTKKTVLKGELLIWRTKNQAREPRYSTTQGFNLLQISPNWFLGNWTLDPHLKWASVRESIVPLFQLRIRSQKDSPPICGIATHVFCSGEFWIRSYHHHPDNYNPIFDLSK